ncbi:B12-binding domain-containing radical SAM protein [Planctomycetota bacterium]|nr:B12-binding domain-containing radical SAM protein [Planctomycetota bacterium]
MKILLASSPHADTFGYSMPPPGLLRLGGALRDASHDVALEDLAFRLGSGDLPAGDGLPVAAAALLASRGRPDVVGLSVMGATLPVALLIAEQLKETWPTVPIVLGGPGVHGVDVELLERFPAVDLVARGEGEVTVVELCEALESGLEAAGAVDGITHREGGEVRRAPDRAMLRDLAALPAYAWDLLPPIAKYKEITGEEDGLVPIDSGRGCAYDCSFCSIGRTWRRRSRPLPAARLVDEMASLRGIPGARRAYLCHDLFGADRNHALALCERLRERDVQVPWEVRARADHLDAELLSAMGGAGCDRVLLGIESASAAVRAANQKGMRDDVDLLQVVDDCAAAGVTPILSLILGLPGEGDDELNESLEFCASAALRAGVNLSLHLVNPQPGCALGEELGAESSPVPGVPPDMALGAGESAAERALILGHPDIFSTWSLLPYPEEKLAELVFLSGEFGDTLMRYPRSVRALAAAAELSILALARDLRADGRTFETFARQRVAGSGMRPVLDALLRWENALVRVAALGSRPAREHRWTLGAELISTRLDLGAAVEVLKEVRASDPRGSAASQSLLAPDDTTFAIVAPAPAPGRLAGVRTVRLSSGSARLAQAMKRARTEEEHARISAALEAPGVRDAAAGLIESGVLVPPADAATSNPSPRARQTTPTTAP